MKTQTLAVLAGLIITQVGAQTILFDFSNAPVQSPLPIDVTVSGVTAHLSATGQGYSIQQAGVQGFTPVGFAGPCVYPSSVYLSDLLVSFSTTLTNFSILYAPQELACDSSATMRVTAYMNANLVGTATTNAAAGTWPTETLRFSSPKGFNNVVIHYDKPPVTGGDYGPVFMADNMEVTLAPPPIHLTGTTRLANGAFQFAFTNTPSTTFTVLASTNFALPIANWTGVGIAAEPASGQYQFADSEATNHPSRFYLIQSP